MHPIYTILAAFVLVTGLTACDTTTSYSMKEWQEMASSRPPY